MNCSSINRRLFVGAAACAAAGAAVVFAGSPAAAATKKADETATGTRTMTDMRGREVEIPEKVERIVAIGCAQRFACYLQAAGMLIAVEESDLQDNVPCTYRHVYHDLFADLPITGDGGSNGALVNEEAVLMANPQLILADSLDADACDALQKKTGIPVVALDQPEAVFDERYYANVAIAGEALGKQERAEEVVAFIKGVETDIAERTADCPKDVTAYACGISYRGGHGFDGTEANFAPFNACGIQNIADEKDLDGPYTIDVEKVITAQPDFIFAECGNLSMIAEDYANSPAVYDALDAVRNGNTYTVVSHRYYSTNVELALANCYQVAATVFPEQFEDVDPVEKLDEICAFLLDSDDCTFFDEHKMSEDLSGIGYEFKQFDIAELE